MKLVFSSNSSWSVYNFRRTLLSTLLIHGHEITIIAPQSEYLKKLETLGYDTIPIAIDNSSKNIISNLKLIVSYYRLYQSIKPDLVMHNAIKPNIYGALVCRLLKIPVVNNISGLGAIFMSHGISSALGKALYRISQKKVKTVFFQNSTDHNLFIKNKLISPAQGRIIPGSGVDLIRFSTVKQNRNDNNIRFCFVGRLLGDKGIYEFIEVAKKIKLNNTNIEFYILGELYLMHPTSVSQEKLDEWVAAKIVTFLGKSDHVEDELNKFDCIVLPSYREGLSRVLLEASSMGIPAITSDVPGCIDVIEHGKSGFICKVKDSEDLYLQMKNFISLSKDERDKMGAYGRLKVEKEFDEKIVIDKYLQAIEEISRSIHTQ